MEDRIIGLKIKWPSGFKSLLTVPKNRVKNYFGEKVAFYFAFLAFYTIFLGLFAPLGIVVFILGLVLDWEHNSFKALTCVYALISLVWGTILIEKWKRKEKNLVAEWGMQ